MYFFHQATVDVVPECVACQQWTNEKYQKIVLEWSFPLCLINWVVSLRHEPQGGWEEKGTGGGLTTPLTTHYFHLNEVAAVTPLWKSLE